VTLTEDSRERVDAWLSDFRECYDGFERVAERRDVSPKYYEATHDRFERGENGGAGIWVRDDEGSVLLVRDAGDDGWVDPGGKREARETFADAARRETREETGVECAITGLLWAHVLESSTKPTPGDRRCTVSSRSSPANPSPRTRRPGLATGRSRPSSGSTPRRSRWATRRSPSDRSPASESGHRTGGRRPGLVGLFVASTVAIGIHIDNRCERHTAGIFPVGTRDGSR
jgi:8-oxo-dGTP pyrophosphatase MutT (NUDIX family)